MKVCKYASQVFFIASECHAHQGVHKASEIGEFSGYYTKFCLFPDRALPFHNNPPVTFQYSPVFPIVNETSAHETGKNL